MGNWVTVKIEGTCNADDLPALRKAVNIGDDLDAFHCLCNSGGICGLGDWAWTEIDEVGNLAERDYGKDDVAEQLRKLVMVAPSLKVDVHVCGDYESKDCIATVICENGKVSVEPPRIQNIPEISQAKIENALLAAISR